GSVLARDRPLLPVRRRGVPRRGCLRVVVRVPALVGLLLGGVRDRIAVVRHLLPVGRRRVPRRFRAVPGGRLLERVGGVVPAGGCELRVLVDRVRVAGRPVELDRRVVIGRGLDPVLRRRARGTGVVLIGGRGIPVGRDLVVAAGVRVERVLRLLRRCDLLPVGRGRAAVRGSAA